ncbi:MAG: PIN domain-containing protein [Dermatophilaceae bacterium]|nr:PIN domain-containing protein [Dermatophilaceae bacterium]
MTQHSVIAVDTSVAVPLLTGSHEAHATVLAWAAGRSLALSGHALVETYSVLTRLPGDARVAAQDAVALIDSNFEVRRVLTERQGADAHREFARLGIDGGAVYDALVALAALNTGATLATRDARARNTYEAIGVEVILV